MALSVGLPGQFPEAEFMTRLGDFRFVSIEIKGRLQVAGFGAARAIGEDEIRNTLASVS
jgi:hypothetical protein